MKKFVKSTLFILSILFLGANVASAQTTPAQKATKTEKSATKKGHKSHHAKTAAMYECPMKCEKPSSKPGKCGKCKMDLVEVKAKK